jgi:hypothetical protein
MDDACKLCREPVASGKHGLSPEDAEKYPQAYCPRCSGPGVVTCVTATKYYFHCACSVWWSEPITLP